MTNEQIQKLIKIANATTCNYKDKQFREDFVQFALEKKLRGRQANMHQLLVDFIRMEFGDIRDASCNFNFKHSVEFGETMEQTFERRCDLDFKKVINNFAGQQRLILVLYFEWDMDLKDIGHALGYSEGRISQLIKEMKPKIRKIYNDQSV
jgi:RNA polymerase sigma factor (sigma-70 family)